jgi:hypothetical protein
MVHSTSREWLAASALSQSADSFVAYLRRHQFEAATGQVYVHVVGHFGRWLTEQLLPLSAIDELLVKRFVAERLPECRCPAPCQRGKPNVRAALAHLLEGANGDGRERTQRRTGKADRTGVSLHDPASQNPI